MNLDQRRVWLIAPGEGEKLWYDWQKNEEVALGFGTNFGDASHLLDEVLIKSQRRWQHALDRHQHIRSRPVPIASQLLGSARLHGATGTALEKSEESVVRMRAPETADTGKFTHAYT